MGCLWTYISWYRDQLMTVFIPLIYLPIPLCIPTQEAWTGYILLVMATYWCTLCIPMWVTGFIPLFTFPLMGILTASEVAGQYMKDSMLTFGGAVMAAYSVEHVNLHYRVALGVLNRISFRPEWLVWGLVLPSWLLSIFIMNTAVLAMMLAVMDSLLNKIEELLRLHSSNASEHVSIQMEDDDKHFEDETGERLRISTVETEMANYKAEEEKAKEEKAKEEKAKEEEAEGYANGTFTNMDEKMEQNDNESVTTLSTLETSTMESSPEVISMGISLSLAICYGAKIGGMAALTGSFINLVAKDYIDDYYADYGLSSPITYTNWMLLCLPISVICVILSNIWMQIQHVGWRTFATCCKTNSDDPIETEAKKSIKKEYDDLGRIKYDEVLVIILYTLLVLLWFFREPGFMPGWGELFPEGYVTDTTPAMLITFFMHFIPRNPLNKGRERGKKKPLNLLEWSLINDKFPWGIYFMVGGGTAVGEACKASGLSEWIASILGWLADIPPVLLVWFVTFSIGLLTEVLTTSTIHAMFMMALGDIAVSMGYSPLYLQLPCAIGAGLTFMLPSSTSSSALTYSFGRITILNMVTTGFMLNIWCSIIVTLGVCTWGVPIFDLYNVPLEMTENYTRTTTMGQPLKLPGWLPWGVEVSEIP